MRIGLTSLVLLISVSCMPTRPETEAARPQESTLAHSGIVSFTFDDCMESVYTEGFRVLEPYDVRCTVYITTSYVGQPGYVTISQLGDLHDAGWEIGGHTVNHPRLPDLPDYMALREIGVCKLILEGWGFHVWTMATPYRATSPEVQAVIPLAGYETNRNGTQGHNTLPLDLYDLKVLTDLTHRTETLKAYIDNVAAWDTWGIFVGHYVDERGIMAQELLEVAIHAHGVGVEILPVSEALERLSLTERPQRSKGGTKVSLGPSEGLEP